MSSFTTLIAVFLVSEAGLSDIELVQNAATMHIDNSKITAFAILGIGPRKFDALDFPIATKFRSFASKHKRISQETFAH